MHTKKNPYFAENVSRLNLQISFSGYAQTDSTWYQPPMPFPYSRLYYVTEGSGLLSSDTESVVLEPGYVYLAPSGSLCGFSCEKSVSKLFFHIRITMPNGCDLFSNSKTFARIPFPVSRIEALSDWYFSNDTVKHAMAKGVIWETVAAFAANQSSSVSRQVQYSQNIRNSIRYISENLHANLTVENVAENVFCSSKTLTNSFRQELGITVGQYIENLIMQEAQWKLLDTNLTVGQISRELGFCDQYYFSRRFRKLFNISPTDYRNCNAKL